MAYQVQEKTPKAVAQQIFESCAGTRVSQLHRVISRIYEQQLKSQGLTVPQLEILSLLCLLERSATPGFLASKLHLERSTMSRNVKVLADRGLLTVTQLSETGRTLQVEVSQTGEKLVAASSQNWNEAQKSMPQSLLDSIEQLDIWIREIESSGEIL